MKNLEVASGGSSIELRLEAKEGEALDREEIENCLEYTENAVCGRPKG